MTVVHAPAKLTLSLRITGVRADGFHLIDAEMVTLSFGDVLRFSDGPTSLSAHGPYADGVPLDGSNLVAAALDAVERTAVVDIDKRIPHGGGLGGGSADAAAVLRWAGWSPTHETLERAARLGADVSFCLVGGRARVRGIGEIVEPLPYLRRTVTLVIPPLRVSTPAAYASVGSTRRAFGARPERPRAGGDRGRADAGPVARPHRRRVRTVTRAGRQRRNVVRARRTQQRPRCVGQRGRSDHRRGDDPITGRPRRPDVLSYLRR